MSTSQETGARSEAGAQQSAAPSGHQFQIAFADQRATIVEVGAGIRAYRDGQRDVLHPYAVDAMADGAHGAPLIPWPNRLDGGRYEFDGIAHQLALTEPEKNTAIHGLLRWRSWQALRHEQDSVVMATRLHPMEGFPFTLDLQIEYRLAADGLTVRTTAVNVGDRAAPYGCGQHPYLSPGDLTIDACELDFAAGTRIDTDAERQLPTGVEPVEGTAFDFRGGRQIGDLAIDFAFTDLVRDGAGRAWVSLRGTDGATAALWVDETYPFIELYTADTLSPDRQRRGLGVEPMTCPPNAFASGERLLRLEPGESVTNTWGACLRRA